METIFAKAIIDKKNKELNIAINISDGRVYNNQGVIFFKQRCKVVEVYKITKKEMEEKKIKTERENKFNSRFEIKEEELVKTKTEKCKKCKFFSICFRTNKRTNNLNKEIAIKIINDCYYQKGFCPEEKIVLYEIFKK